MRDTGQSDRGRVGLNDDLFDFLDFEITLAKGFECSINGGMGMSARRVEFQVDLRDLIITAQILGQVVSFRIVC
jgi:hypothetical protein